MEREKDCFSCRKGSDMINNVPSEAEVEQIEAAKKEREKYARGIFRPINKQPTFHVKDILRDDFIINLIDYFDNPKKMVEARMVVETRRKTIYPEYKIVGLVSLDKFDNAPVCFDLRKKLGYVIGAMMGLKN